MSAQDQEAIEAASRKAAAFAALRQIRQVVDAEQANDVLKSTWTRRFGALFFVAGVVVLSWVLFHAIK